MIKVGKFSGGGFDFCFKKGYRAKDFWMYMLTDTYDSHVSF